MRTTSEMVMASARVGRKFIHAPASTYSDPMAEYAPMRRYNVAAMRGLAGRFPLPVALFAAAGILILAGASFDVQGHTGKTGLEVMAGGLLAVIAGIVHSRWRIAVICALAAVVAVLGALPVEQLRAGHFDVAAGQDALINVLGVAALVLGGVVGSRGYAQVTTELRSRVGDLEHLNRRLEEQHRIFLAATEEPAFSETD